MKVIIYGVGKRYMELCEKFDENGIEIVGFTDGDNNMRGREIVYNKVIYEVKSIHQFDKVEYDKILITTKKYYEEIRKQLLEDGFENETILLADTLLDEIYADKLYHIQYFENKKGIEIGGPSNLFSHIYGKCASCDGLNFCTNTTWGKLETNEFRYADKLLGQSFIAEATDMYQIEDECYDFVLSSNNLEHIANPLKAMREFFRIVKKGGVVLIMVPMKESCFDHDRNYTTFDHLQEDYFNEVEENDLTHLDEIIEKHDYDMDIACGGKDKFIERAKKNIENRCLHHHVFEEKTLRKVFDFACLKVIDISKEQGNWLVIGIRQ